MMQLINENLRDLYLTAGLWGSDAETHTFDGLLKGWVAKKPDEIAVADDPSRSNWTGGDAENLTWYELDLRVSALAHLFKGLGLPDASVIATYGANTVDHVVCLLAIHRAGFISAPIPVFWQRAELSDYLNEIQPRVLITADKLEEDELSLRIRDLAGDVFSVKYVFGLGTDLPDGVVNIAELIPTMMEAIADFEALEPPHPDSVVTLHPTDLQSSETEIALARSSNQWISAHRGMMAEADSHGPVFSPFSLAGIAGFAGGLMHMLITGQSLQLHHFTNEADLLAAIERTRPSISLVPATTQMLRGERYSWPKTQLACIWKNRHLSTTATNLAHDDLDVTCLNEMGVVSQKRSQDVSEPEPIKVQEEPADVALLLNSPKGIGDQKFAMGELFLVGASVPIDLYPTNNETRALSRLRNQQKGFGARPNLGCRVSETGNAVVPIGFLTNALHRNNQVVYEADLDQLYAAVSGVQDAAHIVHPADGRIHAVLVVSDSDLLEVGAFNARLSSEGISESKIPDFVHFIDAIARDASGQTVQSKLMEIIDLDTPDEPLRMAKAG